MYTHSHLSVIIHSDSHVKNLHIYYDFQRWVWAYRQERFLVAVNTNNGIERQNESFKYQYLKDRNKSTLSGMITILVAEFLPDKYQRWASYFS